MTVNFTSLAYKVLLELLFFLQDQEIFQHYVKYFIHLLIYLFVHFSALVGGLAEPWVHLCVSAGRGQDGGQGQLPVHRSPLPRGPE